MHRYLKPFLYMYVVECDDNDEYKSHVRPRLRKWTQRRSDKGQQWCIVYITAQRARSRAKTDLLSMQRGVWSKLKSDFKRERCVRLRRTAHATPNSTPTRRRSATDSASDAAAVARPHSDVCFC